MKYRAPLVILLVLVIWLAASLVRVENQRYALQLGMCIDPTLKVADFTCLTKVETRTSWAAHLLYGMGVL
jgi:hypothetical protein